MSEQIHDLPIDLWNAFDDPDTCSLYEVVAGPEPTIDRGELGSPGLSRVRFESTRRPARIDCALHSDRLDSCFGLRLRSQDGEHHYLLQVSLRDRAFSLLQQKGSDLQCLDRVPIPMPPEVDDFHANLLVEDDGKDIVCRLLDLDLSVRATNGGSVFGNLFQDATGVELDGIGAEGARCRVLRTWNQRPDWNGRDTVEPMWGAQHIWTKIQQRFVGKHDRTYWGWSTISGEVQLRWYDHNEKRFSPIQTIYRYPGRVRWAYDDHHPPGIYIHSDGHVWAWIQSHKTDDPFFLLRSERPEEIDSWQDPIDMNAIPDAPVGGVYPRAYTLSNGDALLFHRTGGSGDGEWHVRRSSDNGVTWSHKKILTNEEGHVYQFVRQNPDNADHLVLVGNHKDTSTTPNSWRRICVWETDDGGETFQTVTDKRKIDLPARRTDLEPVYTDATHQLFVTDQAIRPDGTPLILAAFKDDPDHQTVCLSWQTDHWHLATIAPNEAWPGGGSYKENVWRPSGGSVNPANTNEIVLSLAVDGTHEIQRWKTPDQGLTWEKVGDITSGSAFKNFRPIYIENAHPEDWQLLWHNGEFYGTTVCPGGGRHFDRFDDVMIVNERLLSYIRKASDLRR